jgi:hypothetical protein
MSLTSDPGGHSAQIGRQAFSLPPSSAIPFPPPKKKTGQTKSNALCFL